MNDPLRAGISRRRVLQGTGVAALAALVPAAFLEACSSGGHSPVAHASAQHASATGHNVFDQHQTKLITEATARLIPGPLDDPAEAGHPGAREANVTRYITTMMSALLLSPPQVFAGGPFSGRAGGRDGMAHFLTLDPDRSATWKTRLAAVKLAYDQGLAALDQAAGAQGFLGLDPAGRDRVLASNPKIPALPEGYTGFTDLLFAHAIEGMYSAPEYGGNAGLVGWHDIGFPGDVQPRGYSAAAVSSPLSQEALNPSDAVVKVLDLVSAVSPAPVKAP